MADLTDSAGIITGNVDVLEAFHVMQHAVATGRVPLAYAQQVMSEALLQIVDHYTAASADTRRYA